MATLKAMFKLFDGYSKTIDKINQKTDKATKKILDASGQTDKFNRKLEAMGASANTANNSLGKLVKTVISLAAMKKVIDITDEYTNTAARLDLINDGLQTQAELQDKISAAAKRSRGAYSDMMEAVSKMGLLAGDAFTSNDEMIAFTELVQKSFKVAGAAASEQQGAMRQLTQAMAAGRLQGDELVSIMENAPMIYQAIAKYMGKSKGELKKLSSEGAITADIIKNAMFAAADDINSKFEQMPMTFGEIWTLIKNGGMKAFSPIFQKINQLINNPGFTNFVNNMIYGFNLIAAGAGLVLDAISRISSFISKNWTIIAPIIYGIVGALTAYYTAATLGAIATGILSTAKMIAVPIYALLTGATMAQTAAQWGLNAAMYACPIVWIIIMIIALIALFYAAIAAINKFAGTSVSATGIIAGAFMVAFAFIGNLFVGLWNLIVDIAEAIWNIIATVAEFIANVFVDPIGAVVRLFASLADTILGVLQSIAQAIDAIFGSNLVEAVSGWRNSLKGAVDDLVGEAKIQIPRLDTSSLYLDRFEYGKAWNTGYTAGEKFDDKFNPKKLFGDLPGIDELKGYDLSEFGTSSNPLTIQGIGDNGKVEVDMADEDLKYLRDIAEREYINKFSTATLAPNITIEFGDVHQEADADKVAGRIRKILQEEIAMVAEGAY